MASPAVADLVRVMLVRPGVLSAAEAVYPSEVESVFLPAIPEVAFDDEDWDAVGLEGRSAAEEEPSGWDSVGTSEKRCECDAVFEVVVVRVWVVV